MVSDSTFAAATFVVVGFFVVLLGAYIRIHRRADLLANYDGSADPDEAAVRAGNVIVVVGVAMLAYVAVDWYWRLPESAVLALTIVIIALSFVAAARAQGY